MRAGLEGRGRGWRVRACCWTAGQSGLLCWGVVVKQQEQTPCRFALAFWRCVPAETFWGPLHCVWHTPHCNKFPSEKAMPGRVSFVGGGGRMEKVPIAPPNRTRHPAGWGLAGAFWKIWDGGGLNNRAPPHACIEVMIVPGTRGPSKVRRPLVSCKTH